ncbi:MAG: hypothetical protein PHE67_00320 [Campylobacterales bacterium]|nr:hypothetical protein [Campylobacterales bacterium]
MSCYLYNDSIKSSFHIANNKVKQAYESLMSALSSKDSLCRIEKKDYQSASTLLELMMECRWEPIFNQNGDVVSLKHHYTNVAEEDLLFEALAPYVTNGSYIEFRSEGYDGDLKHRYEFENCTVIKQEWVETYDNENNHFWRKYQ